MTDYVTKDGGVRDTYETGMVREPQVGKARFDLLVVEGLEYEHQMLTRFAMQMARGAEKYSERNWEKARTPGELARAKAAAFRHFMQWFCGLRDEGHAAAVMFNLTEAELIEHRMSAEEQPDKRLITSYDELEALPFGARIRTVNNEIFFRSDEDSWTEIYEADGVEKSVGVVSHRYVLNFAPIEIVRL